MKIELKCELNSDGLDYELTACVASILRTSNETPDNANVEPSEKHGTMSKKRRKEFEANIDKMNWSDKIFQGMLGLRDFPTSVTPRILVFTSHPVLFKHPTVRTIDVGWNAENLPEDGNLPDFWDDLIGIDLVAFAIAYDNQDDLGKHPLKHGALLTEAQVYCEASGAQWLNVDFLDTRRWDHYAIQEPPVICSETIGLTASHVSIELAVTNWAEGTFDDPDKTYHDLFIHDFLEIIMHLGDEFHLHSMTRNAFPAEMLEETPDDEPWDQIEADEDLAENKEDKGEQLISEETLLDTVDVPGLPQKEADRRAAWRKLPQRYRVAVRRLHRQFGHCPKGVMVNLLRAARVHKSYVDAVQYHRCSACESTAPRPRQHKTALSYEFRFGANLGCDLLEVTDAAGHKYTVLNMVDLGTTFQQLVVLREGKNATASMVLCALQNRWFAWAGHPEVLTADRGLHFRGVLLQYCSSHGIMPQERAAGMSRSNCQSGTVGWSDQSHLSQDVCGMSDDRT